MIIWKPDGSLTYVPGLPKKMGNLMLTGLNNLGQFTGNYDTQTYKPEHIIYRNAFVRDPAAGVQVFAQWEYLDPAPSNYFIPVDINDAGLVAGYGLNKDPAQVFETLFYTPATGIYAYPKRSNTASRPLSLNNAGQVLVNQHRHIFLATAPDHYAHIEPPRPNNRPNTQRAGALNNLGQVAGSYARMRDSSRYGGDIGHPVNQFRRSRRGLPAAGRH